MKSYVIFILMISLSAFSSDWVWGTPQLLPFSNTDHEGRITWHGEYLTFWRSIGNNHQMYYSEKMGSSWSPLILIGLPISDPQGEYNAPKYTSDYNHIYFSNRTSETYPDFGIFMSYYDGFSWSSPYLFYYHDGYSGGIWDAAIPDSMEELFFWATISGSQTDCGIYWAKKVSGVWQEPIFLCPNINPSPGISEFQFITPDGQRMYYENHFDSAQLCRLYYSDRLGETEWSTPVAILPSQQASCPSVDEFGNLYFTGTSALHYWAPLINAKIEPTTLGNIKALYH